MLACFPANGKWAHLDNWISIHQARSCCYRDERKPYETIRHDVNERKAEKSHTKREEMVSV